MKSFALLRTNVALTTNVKLMVDSKYSLYLESIDSADELSVSSLKKYQFNQDNFWDELVPNFYKKFPVDIAFNINYANDANNMSDDYSEQYDEMYVTGAKNIINNKNYTEEYEYFAPLYIFKNRIPDNFIIFRVDGPGLVDMDRSNFKSEFVNNFKVVKVIDLTRNSQLGVFIDRNWKTNENFPPTGLDLDFRELEFTKWIGIDYESGGYTHKSLYFDEELEKESPLFDLEQLITDGYRMNKVIHPNIVNFTFLFDDTPATPDTLRKWSMNRYSGFYVDSMEEYDRIHPYKLPELQNDVVIGEGNKIYSISKSNPFKKGFKDDGTMWVEYLGNFYRVETYQSQLSKRVTAEKSGIRNKQLIIDKVNSPTETAYRIISDIDLSGKQSLLNGKYCYIDDQGRIIKSSTDSAYTINNHDFSDVTLIKIDGVYHTVIFENGYYKLNTDYGFKYSESYRLTYYTNSGVEGYTDFVDLNITENNIPEGFPIYRLNFTDIKDFDTNIIDTEFSKFEYERRNELTVTEEPKLYMSDLRSNSNPPPFDDFKFNGETELIPTSSDYTANLETFRTEEGDLSELWRKSPTHLRWSYQNSLSAHDYPYLMNNTDLLGQFNQTVNTKEIIPFRSERNLDYFYTINSGTTSHIHHTLHIEKNKGFTQDETYKFKLDDYLNVSTYSYYGNTYSYDFNYFDMFFSQTQSFLDGDISRDSKKFSYFETGDTSIPNTTVFKGMKFKMFEVDSIIKDSVSVNNLNLHTTNKFEDYKFTILLSSNDHGVSNDGTLYETCDLNTYETAISLGGGITQFLVNTTGTPSLNVGDEIEIDFPVNELTLSEITYVGSVPGGYGFNANTGYDVSQSTPGIWRGKMQWKRIFNFEHDVEYKTGDIVLYEGRTYWALSDLIITDPTENPAILWGTFAPYSTAATFEPMFWRGNTDTTYAPGEWVYIYDEYYENDLGGNTYNPYNPTQVTDFWDPEQSYYSTYSVVNYQNRFYEAEKLVPNGIRPVVSNKKIAVNYDGSKYWNEITSSQVNNFKWKKIPLWDVNETISGGIKRIHDDVLYLNIGTPSSTGEDVPGTSPNWERVYSFEPETEYKYSPYTNPVIKMSEWFYLNTYNPGQIPPPYGTGGTAGDYSLDNGISIYIHKPFKNVFVNIAINDNTLQAFEDVTDETRNIERDLLYVQPNSRITAANFIRQLNDLDTLYGFADYTSYVVVDDDFSISKYKFDNDLENLPYYLLVEEADGFSIDDSSLSYKSDGLSKNILKSFRYLDDGEIDNLEKINFYNENPIAYTIENVKDEFPVTQNLNGQNTNDTTTTLFRHSGYYMPLVYDIELFKNPSTYESFICNDGNCPIITWNWRYTDDPNLFYGVSYSTTPIPLFYTGDDTIGQPQYSGALSINGLIEIELYHGTTGWELYWTSGTYSANVMTGDSLLGSYSWSGDSSFGSTQSRFFDTDIVCGDLSDSWLITQQVTATISNSYPAYATYNDTEDPIIYMIFPDQLSGSWSTQSSLWDFTLDGCSFTHLAPQTSIIEGTYSNACGTVSFAPNLEPSSFGIDFIDPCVRSLTMSNGNYKFDTDLSLFGIKQQRVIQKVNEVENVLKLKNNDSFDSIYPMLDEYGYMVADFFIFKSTWDYLYHYKTDNPKITSVPSQQNIFRTLYLNQIIKNYNII
jgi:hypothetical protein